MNWRRAVVRVGRWHPLQSRRSVRIWLAAWAFIMAGAVCLSIVGRATWTVPLVYLAGLPSVVPSLIRLRFQYRRRQRCEAPVDWYMNWRNLATMYATGWLLSFVIISARL